jgi:hypothetical protein
MSFAHVKSPLVENDPNDMDPYTVEKMAKLKWFFTDMQNIANAIYQDVISTFQPYKSAYYSRYEWMQPLQGIKDTIIGATWLSVSPLIIVWNLIQDVRKSRGITHLLTNVGITIVTAASRILSNVVTLLRGLTQIVATPLILVKKLLRNIISYFSGEQKFENLSSTKDLVKQGEEALNEQPAPNRQKAQQIMKLLHNSFETECFKKKVATDVNRLKVLEVYVDCAVHNRQKPGVEFNYFHLFSQRQNPPVAVIAPEPLSIEKIQLAFGLYVAPKEIEILDDGSISITMGEGLEAARASWMIESKLNDVHIYPVKNLIQDSLQCQILAEDKEAFLAYVEKQMPVIAPIQRNNPPRP